MAYKFYRLALISFIFSLNIYAQSFPTNFNSESLILAKENAEKWNGKTIAVECSISKIKKGYKSKPYCKCNFEDGTSIWVGFLIKNELNIGDKMRLLGYFSIVEKDDKVSKKYNLDNFHLLAFAVLNLSKQKAYHLPGVEQQFSDWKNGFIE